VFLFHFVARLTQLPDFLEITNRSFAIKIFVFNRWAVPSHGPYGFAIYAHVDGGIQGSILSESSKSSGTPLVLALALS